MLFIVRPFGVANHVSSERARSGSASRPREGLKRVPISRRVQVNFRRIRQFHRHSSAEKPLTGVQETLLLQRIDRAGFTKLIRTILPGKLTAIQASQAITAALSGQLAKFKQPKQVILLDALPRNTMGKVQKKALREVYAGVFIGE